MQAKTKKILTISGVLIPSALILGDIGMVAFELLTPWEPVYNSRAKLPSNCNKAHRPVEAIFTGSINRVEKGVDLLRQNPSIAALRISGIGTLAHPDEYIKRRGLANDIRHRDISLDDAADTLANAKATASFVRSKGACEVIITTSDLHAARGFIETRRALAAKDYSAKVLVNLVPTHYTVKNIFIEGVKLNAALLKLEKLPFRNPFMRSHDLRPAPISVYDTRLALRPV